MRRIIAILSIAVSASLFAVAFVTEASADGTYDTTRIALHSTAGAPGGGTVINIHANGPTVYAHEIYLLQGATPGSYQVTIHLYPSATNCSGTVMDLPTATLTTNTVGNGKADVKFTPADAAGIRNSTVSATWSVVGPATYASDCSVITLD